MWLFACATALFALAGRTGASKPPIQVENFEAVLTIANTIYLVLQ